MPDSRPGRVRVAVLISGGGSNMAALIDATQQAECPYRIVRVISNQPDAGGLAIARAKDVEALAIDHCPFGKDREAHERAIQSAPVSYTHLTLPTNREV